MPPPGQQIDLSAGMVNTPPPTQPQQGGGGIDLSAGMVNQPQTQTQTQTTPPLTGVAKFEADLADYVKDHPEDTKAQAYFRQFGGHLVNAITQPVLHPIQTATDMLKSMDYSNVLKQQPQPWPTGPQWAGLAGDVVGSTALGEGVGELGGAVAKPIKAAIRPATEKAATSLAKAMPEAAKVGETEIPRVAKGAPGKVQAQQAAAQQAALQKSFGNVMDRSLDRALKPYDDIDPRPAAHFGEVADQIKDAAATDFDELSARASTLRGEDVGKEVDRLNQAVNDAPMEERGAAKQDLYNYLDSIDDPRYPDSLRDTAIRARDTYRKQFMAEDLHKMMGKYFNYASPETAQMMDQPYSLDLAGEGENMKADLRKLENEHGHDALVDFLGKDGFKNLHQMADVASDPAYNANANDILKQVVTGAHEGMKGKWAASSILSHFAQLPFMKTLGVLKTAGAVKGGAEAALPMLKYQIATNPRVGALLTYAAKNNVSPRYASPFIRAAIYGELMEAAREKGAQ